MSDIERLGQGVLWLLFLSFFLVLGILGFLLWYGWYISKTRGALCPYTKQPMLLGTDFAPSVRKYVESFLSNHPQPENTPFDFAKAALSEKTGRIFPNCVTKGEIIRLKWDFLQKRYPGNYVSWGSLTQTEQAMVRMCHESFAGFQSEVSSPKPMPQEIDRYYAHVKPGPLYVDKATKILLGWKVVPGTQFEVLIVQKPTIESIEEIL